MADIDRRVRFAGKCKQLLDVAIETRNVSAGVALARLIMRLNGWLDKSEELPETPQPAPDMTALLEHVKEQ